MRKFEPMRLLGMPFHAKSVWAGKKENRRRVSTMQEVRTELTGMK